MRQPSCGATFCWRVELMNEPYIKGDGTQKSVQLLKVIHHINPPDRLETTYHDY